MATLPNASQQQLRQFIEQIERLEAEKKAIGDDVKDVFSNAKGMGFDVKVMRQVLRLRKKSLTERQEEESVLDVYLHALGMLSEVAEQVGPLGQAAFEREIDPSKVTKGKPKIAGDGYLDKVREKYEAAVERDASHMMMPDGFSVHAVSDVKQVLKDYGAIA